MAAPEQPDKTPSRAEAGTKDGHPYRSSLSSWVIGSGISWIQTTEAQFARKLAKRSDTRLVAVGVAGGFLRIFAMRRSPAFMRRLIARYEAANARFCEPGEHSNARRVAGG